ncbi:MAG: hypothetical protein AB4372_12935 [Xenococcus sp. (in: cyanobacteria)]
MTNSNTINHKYRRKISIIFLSYIGLILLQFYFYYFKTLEAYPAIILPAFSDPGNHQTIEVPNYRIKVHFQDGSTEEMDFKKLFKTIPWSNRHTVFWIFTENLSFLDSVPTSKTLGLLSDSRFIGAIKDQKQQEEFNTWLKTKLKIKGKTIKKIIFINKKSIYQKVYPPQKKQLMVVEKKTINFD